jgi:PleD family two-component response regulator
MYVSAKIGGNNGLALQFGLMTVSYTGLLVGAVITQHNRAEKQLLYDTSHDNLTKLYNRAGFMDKLERALAELA